MAAGKGEGKKRPIYLEEIPFDDGTLPWENSRDMFAHSDLFLGRYTEDAILKLMEKTGLLDIIKKRGYDNLLINVSRQDYTSRLYVNYDTFDKETRLLELILREGVFRPSVSFVERFDFCMGLPMNLVEWLSLQDPRGQFSAERPRLPSQAYPGLGGLRNMQKMLKSFARKTYKDAVVDVPQHYHSAIIYAHMYSFFSPVDAGLFKAIRRDVDGTGSLADLSSAISMGCLRNNITGQYVPWHPSEQIYPINPSVQDYLDCPEYKEIEKQTESQSKFSIDWDKYAELLSMGVTADE